jgi:hypothetical protein
MERFHWPLPLFLIFFLSCHSEENKTFPKMSVEKDEIAYDDQGTYRAFLKPLNSQFGHVVSGNIQVIVSGDNFEVLGQVLSAPSHTKHLQFITYGSHCPDGEDDKNKDGFIDLDELFNKSGRVIIPLDSDLSEQLMGNDFGPIANGNGKYIYKESTSFSFLLNDLFTEDPDRTDIYKKLSPNEKLNLSKRVVVVLGLNEDTILPSTLKNPTIFTIQESVPIACGEFTKVSFDDRL